MVFSGAVSNSTLDLGLHDDTLTFSSSLVTSTLIGGAGHDTMLFSDVVSNSSINAGAGSDTLSFSTSFVSSTLLAGAGDDTLTFSGVVNASKISLGAGNVGVTFSTLAGANTSILGGGNSSQTINFSAAADLVSFDGTFGAGSIMGGSGNDTVVFLTGAALNASSVVKLDAGNDSLVFNTNVVSGQFGAGAGNDFVGGSVTVGSTGVSFWGGAGNDTFNFTAISNGGGTAYFWNEGGDDSIVLGGAVSYGLNAGAPVVFGITSGASTAVSFGTGSIGVEATTTFGAGTMSSSWSVGNNNLVSFGFGTARTTILFSTGSTITLVGGVFDTAAGTNIFSNALASTGTGNFGIVGSIPTFS